LLYKEQKLLYVLYFTDTPAQNRSLLSTYLQRSATAANHAIILHLNRGLHPSPVCSRQALFIYGFNAFAFTLPALRFIA
jgi:hypothetical protein